MSQAHTPTKIPGYRWRIVALLFLATTINYMDRQILALVKPILDTELKWTDVEYAAVNSAFQGAYATGLFLFGWLIDKIGVRKGYALSVGAWSLAAIGHALVGSIGGFSFARVALGLGEAGNFPGAIKAVARWFPRSERSFATSLFNSGANVAAIIAPATIPFIADAWGWKAAFVIAGALGFLWLLIWFPVYNNPEEHKSLAKAELDHILSDREDEGAPTNKVPWKKLLGYRQTWSFIVGKFLTDPVWWFFLIWLPDYFKTSQGLDLKKLGLPIIAIYAIVTVLSIFGGWLPGKLIANGWSATKARKTCMLVFALCALPIIAVKGAGLWGAVCLIGLAGAAHQAWSANIFTTASEMFPKHVIGSIVGIGGMAGSVGGMLFPLLCGFILKHYKEQGDASTGYGILFTICGSAYIIAFVLNHLLAPKFDRVNLDTPAT